MESALITENLCGSKSSRSSVFPTPVGPKRKIMWLKGLLFFWYLEMYFTFECSCKDFADNFAIVLFYLFAAASGIAQDVSLFDGYTGNLVDVLFKINKAAQWNAHRYSPLPLSTVLLQHTHDKDFT